MEGDSVLEALLAYGADPEVLEEYDCIPRKARVHHDVLKLRTEWGACSLKKVDFSPSRLRYVHGCTEYVHEHKSQDMFVPRMIRNRYGDPFVIHPSGVYYMTAWHSGREADLRKSAELEGAAGALGTWHAAAAGFHGQDAPDSPNMLQRLEHTRQQIDVYRETVSHKSEKTAFERLFVSCADELVTRLVEAVMALVSASYSDYEAQAREQGWICHGNLTRPNVIYDGATYTLINYDKVHPGAPMNDLALMLHRYMPAHNWEPPILAQAISSYRSTAPNVFLDEPSLRALLSVPLRSLQVVLWYFSGSRDWDEEDFVDYLESCLDAEEARDAAVDTITESTWAEPRVTLQSSPSPLVLARQEADVSMDEGIEIPIEMEQEASQTNDDEVPEEIDLPNRDSTPKPKTERSQPTKKAARTRRRRRLAARRSAVTGPSLWRNDGRNPND